MNYPERINNTVELEDFLKYGIRYFCVMVLNSNKLFC